MPCVRRWVFAGTLLVPILGVRLLGCTSSGSSSSSLDPEAGDPSPPTDGSDLTRSDGSTSSDSGSRADSEAADAGLCRLEGDRCSDCTCGEAPSPGHRVHLESDCYDQVPTPLVCRSAPGANNDCVSQPAIGCLSRTLADGGVEAFFFGTLPTTFGDSNLLPCDGALSTLVKQMDPCP